jgi:hypothetical protein
MPDFGIFRGFNEKLFGDKLVAGQLPTQLGLIGSSDFSGINDTDVLAFFDRVTTAGGTLSDTEKSAVNKLVLDMKDDGIWTKMKAIYPMVGASAAACAQNLKSSSFTGTFNGGWTFASSGIKGNGINSFLNTNLVLRTTLTNLYSTHLAYYINENAAIGSFQIGVRGGADTMIGARFSSTNSYNNVDTTSVTTRSELNDVSGFLCVSRINISQFKYFKNNSVDQIYNITGIQQPINNVYIGAMNINGVFLPDSTSSAFASIGDGLTDTEASDFYTAVQAFQTTLSRQV